MQPPRAAAVRTVSKLILGVRIVAYGTSFSGTYQCSDGTSSHGPTHAFLSPITVIEHTISNTADLN
jgi:hypothetical protein